MRASLSLAGQAHSQGTAAWGGGAGAITTRPGPVLSSHRPGDMGQAGLAAPSWGKGGVCPNLELSGQ